MAIVSSEELRRSAIADFQGGAYIDYGMANNFIEKYRVQGFERPREAKPGSSTLQISDKPAAECDFWGIDLTPERSGSDKQWTVFLSRRSYQKFASMSGEGGLPWKRYLDGLFALSADHHRGTDPFPQDPIIMQQVGTDTIRLELGTSANGGKPEKPIASPQDTFPKAGSEVAVRTAEEQVRVGLDALRKLARISGPDGAAARTTLKQLAMALNNVVAEHERT